MRHFTDITAHVDVIPAIRVADASDAPWISSIVGIDCTEAMARMTTLVSRNGGFFVDPITSSVAEVHMFYRPEGRGREALHAARAGLAHIFRVMGISVLFGRIPIEDRPSRLFTRIIGFRSDGIRPREPGGPLCEWFELRSEACPQQQP